MADRTLSEQLYSILFCTLPCSTVANIARSARPGDEGSNYTVSSRDYPLPTPCRALRIAQRSLHYLTTKFDFSKLYKLFLSCLLR
ncbi:hypothetical protein J6590_027547 [Homalodisca vitripennis]|nr:hypothetical protein J6590_027547 [Homalodisca vitripennis]